MSRFFMGLLAMAMIMIPATGALAQGSDGLQGIQSVYVLIQDLPEELAKDGLTQEILRKDMEEPILATGLRVLSLEESMEARPDQGILRLVIMSQPVSENNRIYAVRLDFRRKVMIAGQPETQLMASTWQALDIGMTPIKDMLEIRSAARDLVSKFAADHSNANPKVPGKSSK
ncbi:MAG: hypothetical protein KJ970_09620 [Candidatus Eisenbacteria bacterium]|uniref:Uncharacterized protein n=1 Tax=Eiseniibacteriota bacterium TaxID=2212470 RepID=A0A948W3J9_UNCEI|nr:hypothetical protein [Candidatus Eisenbacteria bacterium]MBU1949074.1 hypothetical protein [Candidatus Eisenbacteria bacterium]MBU2691177.1 hypothetical protein [Candidatus Eisenbacteria bacterium]